jgi:hypothetical protein
MNTATTNETIPAQLNAPYRPADEYSWSRRSRSLRRYIHMSTRNTAAHDAMATPSTSRNPRNEKMKSLLAMNSR